MILLKDLKINGRVDKILNFDKEDEANNTYIVKQQAGSPITLFELGTKDNYISTDNAMRNLTISNIEKEVDDNCVTIKITLGDKLSPVLLNCQYYNSDMGHYSPKEILKLQEKINEQIESAHKVIAQDQSIDEMCSQLASSQEAIRQMLEKCYKELMGGNENNRKMAKDISTMMHLMEQTNKDVSNGPIKSQTIKYQQQILEYLHKHVNIENLNGITYNTITVNNTQAHQLQLKKVEKPHILLQFGISGILKKKNIHIYAEDVVYNAIVDFGSEASQACWLKDSPEPKSIKLTGSIRKASSLNEKKDSDFEQYEYDKKERIDLYRSIYYIKKKLTYDDLTNLDVWPDYSKETVRFLVDVTEEKTDIATKYIQIPNTKLLSFTTRGYANSWVSFNGDDYDIKDIKEGVIPTMVMNNIILQTLTTIENKITASGSENNACGLILNILMPNVYPIHMVSQKLNQLAENIKQIKTKIPHINGVELRYVSESDASLLGYLNMHTDKRLRGEDYLIIDAGKGTLDFSLLSVDRGTGLTNKRRGGIVGAGAAITYGVLVGLVNEYLTGYCKDYDNKSLADREHLIQDFIYNQILKCGDIAIVNKTMKNIEEYKKVYNSHYGASHSNIEFDQIGGSSFEDLRLNDETNSFNLVVESWIKDNHNLSEESAKYVTAEINLIVQEALKKMISSLYNERAQVVVFTGRGCLMTELRVRLKEELISHNLLEDATGNELVAKDTMKTGCMRINQLLITGNYDTAESNQSVTTHSLLENDDENKRNAVHKQQEEPDIIDKLRGRIERQGINTILRGYRSATTFGNLSHGINLGTITSILSLINIGGFYYYIHNRFVNKKCTLFYDGSNYIITANNIEPQVISDEYKVGIDDAKLEFESLFPNINIQDNEAERIVVIPRFEKATEQEGIPPIEEKEEKEENKENESQNKKENRRTFIWKIFHIKTLIQEKKLKKKQLANNEERKEAENSSEQELQSPDEALFKLLKSMGKKNKKNK